MERKKKKSLPKRFATAMRKNWQLYLMALPAMVLLFCFAYMPMGGLVIAFKRYNFKDGIWGSPWIDPIFKNFEILFKNNSAALQAIRNTVLLNLLFISVGTIFALALSLALEGFSFDATDVKTEVAQRNQIFGDAQKLLEVGLAGDTDTALEKIKTDSEGAGFQSVLDEYQRQIDEFLAAKDK